MGPGHSGLQGCGSLKWDSTIWSWVLRYLEARVTELPWPASNCTSKLQTHPLVREVATHTQTRKCLTVMKIWLWVPDGCPTPKQTGRLTVELQHNYNFSWHLLHAGSLFSWFSTLMMEVIRFLRNVGSHTNLTAVYPKRWQHSEDFLLNILVDMFVSRRKFVGSYTAFWLNKFDKIRQLATIKWKIVYSFLSLNIHRIL
jgi:hypothetical protein